MKRNMELIREILLFVEESCDGKKYVSIEDAHLHEDDRYVIYEHCRLLIDKHLVKAMLTDEMVCYFDALTWEGHDFLDNARNSTVWKAAVKSAGKLSFGVFQKVLESAAVAFAMKELSKTIP